MYTLNLPSPFIPPVFAFHTSPPQSPCITLTQPIWQGTPSPIFREMNCPKIWWENGRSYLRFPSGGVYLSVPENTPLLNRRIRTVNLKIRIVEHRLGWKVILATGKGVPVAGRVFSTHLAAENFAARCCKYIRRGADVNLALELLE